MEGDQDGVVTLGQGGQVQGPGQQTLSQVRGWSTQEEGGTRGKAVGRAVREGAVEQEPGTSAGHAQEPGPA